MWRRPIVAGIIPTSGEYGMAAEYSMCGVCSGSASILPSRNVYHVRIARSGMAGPRIYVCANFKPPLPPPPGLIAPAGLLPHTSCHEVSLDSWVIVPPFGHSVWILPHRGVLDASPTCKKLLQAGPPPQLGRHAVTHNRASDWSLSQGMNNRC